MLQNETEKENIAEAAQTSKSHLNDVAPVLLCQPNQTPLWIGFGCVGVGSVVTRHFRLINPQISSIEVAIQSSFDKSDIVVTFPETQDKIIALQPGGSVRGEITWSPEKNRSLSETIELSLNMATTLAISVHGFAGIGAVSLIFSLFSRSDRNLPLEQRMQKFGNQTT
jgi:hypothetical protein